MGSTVFNFSLLLYAAKIAMVISHCSVTQLSHENENPCIGLLTCSDYIDKFASNADDWPCLMWDVSRWKYRAKENFFLHVKLDKKFSAREIQQFFGNLNNFKFYVTSISVTNAAMTSINTLAYDLFNATNIDFSQNEINSFSLGKFSRMKSLDSLNLSRNAIDTLDMDNGTYEYIPVNSLSVLDLSHNLIETVPIYYFRDAPEILHLNLSHNSIELFDNLTFEGLPKLKTLTLTNNKLTQIGSFVGRMVNLQELRLDYNYLEHLNDMKISASSSLQKLSVSNNNVKYVGSTLQYAFSLTELNLSHNSLDVILKSQFLNARNLTCLDLSHNNISRMQAAAFKGKNILYFRVHSNRITGLLDDRQFEGINSDELDLSGGKISELGSELFVGQNLRLRVLNFSNNFIYKIKKSSFHNVNLLTELDLSNNKLENINFDTKDLGKLTHLYAKHNLINKMTKEMLSNLISLELLDISHNAIEDIDDQAFVNLNNLKFLILNNNPLSNAIKAETFFGLNLLSDINLTYTNIKCLKNETLKGTIYLRTFNASLSNINTIEFNFFYGTGPVQIIDLSHNEIKLFLVNNTNIKQASEIYLSDNKLEYISNNTFLGLTQLQILKLDDNKIVSIQPGSFASAMSIKFLNLHNNSLHSFQFGIFDGMVYLENLNLSGNALTDVTAHLFYKNIGLETLALDDNYLSNLDCIKFSTIKKLSLGGNSFECTFILKCMHEMLIHNAKITAQNKNFHSENVDGITCNSDSSYFMNTRLVNNSTEVTNHTASRGITKSDFNTTILNKMSILNSKTPDFSNSNSARNVVDHLLIVFCLVVIACLLMLNFSVLTLIFNLYKKHRFNNGHHVNERDISFTNRAEIEL